MLPYLVVGVALAAVGAHAQTGCPVPVACPVGFTGRYCDIVMCDAKGMAPNPPPPELGFYIDIVPFQTTCAGTIDVPVDSHVQVLVLSVDGFDSSANPSISVVNDQGKPVPPTKNVTMNGKTITLGWSAPPPGVYRATINAATKCVYKAQAQTNMTLSFGFTYGGRAMFNDKPSESLKELTVATMVTHMHRLPQPGYARLVEVFDQTAVVQGYDYRTRYRCAYEQYAGPIVCDSSNLYYFKVHGVDDNGYRFMRSSEFQCTPSGVSTTTSMPMTTPTPACMHGGFMDPTTGKCVCELGIWTGDKCETPVCYNGGSAVNGQCQCAQGYGGFHCFDAMCSTQNPAMPSDMQKSMAIVVQTTSSMMEDIGALQRYILELVETFNQEHPMFVKNYVLAQFDDSTAKVISNTNDAFVLSEQVWHMKVNNGTQKCPKRINEALVEVLKLVEQNSYTFVLTDSPANLDNTTTSLTAIQMIENTANKVHFFYTPAPACANYTSDGVQRLTQLAEFSGGQMFYAQSKSSVFQLLHFPHTTFKTGRVYDKLEVNCNARRLRTYVPVDESTSALTVTVHGNHPSIIVFDPRGTPYPMVPIVADDLVQSRRALRPCPSSWTQVEDTCFLPVFDARSWNYAQVDCRIKGGTLNQELNPEKAGIMEFLAEGVDYWTGLNDIATYGTWVWDSITDPPIPAGHHFNAWGPGQPSDPTKTKRCALVTHTSNGTASWTATSCDDRHAYVCQRHALDFDGDKLMAGLWAVETQTHTTGGDWGKACQIQVDVQSDINVYAGYTKGANGQFDDMVTAEPSEKANDNRFAASITGLTEFSRPEQVSFYANGDGALVASSHLHHRLNCTYGWYGDAFTCPKTAFGTMVSGHDSKGNLFTRMAYGVCLGATAESKLAAFEARLRA